MPNHPSHPFLLDAAFVGGLSFQEEVLCDLNRSTQDPGFFECHAFQPLLKLVASSRRETRVEPKAQSVGITSEKLLDSDRVKYKRALALQKPAGNPDDIMLDIKYHFVWNVIGRKPVFAAPEPSVRVVLGHFVFVYIHAWMAMAVWDDFL